MNEVNETKEVVNEVRFPIETTRDGEKITKVCVEDIYKIVNRTIEAIDKAYNNSMEILDSVHKEYGEWEGELILAKGVSQPCSGDKFDEEIGNEIAFMKMKLNANIKKHNLIKKVLNQYGKSVLSIFEELGKIDDHIKADLAGIRRYNPEYLEGIEDKLSLIDYQYI